MPLNREHIQLAVILLAVPAQYFIAQKMGSNEVSRTYAISQMVSQFKDIKARWLHVEPWKKWCLSLYEQLKEGKLSSLTSAGGRVDAEEPGTGESPAFEVEYPSLCKLL